MKKIALLLIAMSLFLSACPGEFVEPVVFTSYEPVLMQREQMESSVRLEAGREINNPAKIYRKDGYLFISEKYKGIHIINNLDPKKPVNTGFIRIPGCVDVAMKGNILYADNATDLLAIDLSNLSQVAVVKRIKNAFPVLLPPDLGEIPTAYANRPEDMIIVGWKKKDN